MASTPRSASSPPPRPGPAHGADDTGHVLAVRVGVEGHAVPGSGMLGRVIVRDMTEDDLDALFDIQDDITAQHMAAFTSPDGNDRAAYTTKFRKIFHDDQITTKVIVVDGEIVGSVASFVVEGDTEVTYWIRRDQWGRGIASAALAVLLREVTVRPIFARAAADNAGSARVLLRNGFERVGEETSYAEARGAAITEHVYRLDDPPDTGPA